MGQKPSKIVEQPVGDQVVCVGESVTLSVAAEGTHLYTWQFSQDGEYGWHDVSGPRFEGAGGNVLRVVDVQKSDRGFYRCLLHHGKIGQDSVISRPSALIVVSLPVILSPESDESSVAVKDGDSTALSVQAEGEELVYQWQQRRQQEAEQSSLQQGAGAELSSSSRSGCNSEKILAEIHPTLIQFLNVKCAIPYLRQSGLITRDQLERLRLPNKINSDMVNDLVIWLPMTGRGYLATFVSSLRDSSKDCPAHSDLADKIEADTRRLGDSGSEALQVVFSSSEDGWVDLKDNDTFSGCDKPCLSLNSVRACHASLYRCRVFNAAGPVFSHPIILAVVCVPRIIADLEGVRVRLHDKVSLRVTATSESSLCFVWQRKALNSTEWHDVSEDDARFEGQGSDSLTIAEVEEGDVGVLRCRVHSSGGQVVTKEAPLKIVFPPVITGEPCDVKAKPHCEANFVVDASCEEPMTYAWQTKKRDGDSDGGGWRDVGSGSEVSGGDTRCLVVADVREEEDAGLYRCVVSSEGGNSTTREVSLEIVHVPKITEHPESAKVKPYDRATFRVGVQCKAQVSFKWRMKTSNSTEWREVPLGSKYEGQGTCSLVVLGVEEEDVGLYRCTVSSEGGECATNDATLRCAPRITEHPGDVKIKPHSDVTFTVAASCEDPLTYHWQARLGETSEWCDVPSKCQGEDTPTLVVPDVEKEDEGLYRCVVDSSESGDNVTSQASLRIVVQYWRQRTDSVTFADLSLQLGKLSAEEGHVNMSTLREISQLQKTMVGFRGSMERYRVKVQSESGCEGRPLMKQGSLVKLSRTGKATRYLLLFSDVLIVTERKRDQYLFKEAMPIHFMKVRGKSAHSDSAMWFDVLSVTRSLSLIAKSSEDKTEWVEELQKCIEAYNKNIERDPLLTDKNYLVHAPINVRDEHVSKCQLCEKSFTLIFRRHHCRKCGRIICDPCSLGRLQLPHTKEPERVCDECNPSKPVASPDAKDESMDERTARQRPASTEEVLKRGYVKCSSVRMWYELDPSRVLYIYRAPQDPSAERTLPLLGYLLLVSPGDLILRLTHPQETEEFSVEDLTEFDQWKEAIERVLS